MLIAPSFGLSAMRRKAICVLPFRLFSLLLLLLPSISLSEALNPGGKATLETSQMAMPRDESSSNFRVGGKPKAARTNPTQAKMATKRDQKKRSGPKTAEKMSKVLNVQKPRRKGTSLWDAKRNFGSGNPPPSLQETPQATRLARPDHPPPGKPSCPLPPADLLHIWTAPAAAEGKKLSKDKRTARKS